MVDDLSKKKIDLKARIKDMKKPALVRPPEKPVTPEAPVTPVRTMFEPGERMPDGTIALLVDKYSEPVVSLCGQIFGGVAGIGEREQKAVVEKANADGLHGHNDWRLGTSEELGLVARQWHKYAPRALQHGEPPTYWGEMLPGGKARHVLRGSSSGSEAMENACTMGGSHPVVLVRGKPPALT